MKTPLELLKETELMLFSLESKELKEKTKQLLKDLPKKAHLTLAHQISQRRQVKKNFLSWLEISCPCAKCQEK